MEIKLKWFWSILLIFILSIEFCASLIKTVRPVKVKIIRRPIQGGAFSGLDTQITDSTRYEFDDSESLFLDTYTSLDADVLLLGYSLMPADEGALSTSDLQNIVDFVNNGGGLVVMGDFARAVCSSSDRSIIQPIIPINLQGCPSSGVTITECPTTNDLVFDKGVEISSGFLNHPIYLNVDPPMTTNGPFSYSGAGKAFGQTIGEIFNNVAEHCVGLTEENKNQGVIIHEFPGGGRVVYLTFAYASSGPVGAIKRDSSAFRSGRIDRLLENALFWAANVTLLCPEECQNGGICVGPSTCDCSTTGSPPLYGGDFCTIPLCYPSCQNGGICNDEFQCVCINHWGGVDCTSPQCPSITCLNGGSCGPTPNTCTCVNGWLPGPSGNCSGFQCLAPCQHNGTCVAPELCSCPPEWTGNQCQLPRCNPLCQNNRPCIEGDPHYCDCEGLFTGIACETPLYNCTPPCINGACKNNNNECQCLIGWEGDRCEDAICPSPCLNNGTCVAPSFCQCPPNTQGSQCETVLFTCTPVCRFGGVCIAQDTCNCTDQYFGGYCQFPICDPPCQNNGTCGAPDVCFCDSTGYSGQYCQQPICSPPCQNGDCIAPNTCNCTEGWTGNTCGARISTPSPSSEETKDPGRFGLGEQYDLPIIAGGAGFLGCLLILCGLWCCVKCMPSKGPKRSRNEDIGLELYD